MFYFVGPRIIAEQEHNGDQFLAKNVSVKVRHLLDRRICIGSSALKYLRTVVKEMPITLNLMENVDKRVTAWRIRLLLHNAS